MQASNIILLSQDILERLVLLLDQLYPLHENVSINNSLTDCPTGRLLPTDRSNRGSEARTAFSPNLPSRRGEGSSKGKR